MSGTQDPKAIRDDDTFKTQELQPEHVPLDRHLAPGEEDLNSGLYPNLNNDIIDIIQHQELSAPQELYQGSELDHDQAKSAVLVTDDRAMQLKASASGVCSVSPSVFRSFKSDEK